MSAEDAAFRQQIVYSNLLTKKKKNIVYSNLLTKKKHVRGIFCDLAKACDCMNHEILVAKLHFCGI